MTPEPNHSLDSRRLARDQEARIAATAVNGFSLFKPYIQFNAAMLQVWSNALAMVAHNFEKSFEAFGGVVNEQKQESQSQHY